MVLEGAGPLRNRAGKTRNTQLEWGGGQRGMGRVDFRVQEAGTQPQLKIARPTGSGGGPQSGNTRPLGGCPGCGYLLPECQTPWPPHFGFPILGLPSSARRQLDHLLRISVRLSATCRVLPGGCEGPPFSRRPPPTLKSALTLSPARSGQPRPPASSGTRIHRAGIPLPWAELTEGGRGTPDKGEVQGPHLQGTGVDAAGETGGWDTLPGKRA